MIERLLHFVFFTLLESDADRLKALHLIDVCSYCGADTRSAPCHCWNDE